MGVVCYNFRVNIFVRCLHNMLFIKNRKKFIETSATYVAIGVFFSLFSAKNNLVRSNTCSASMVSKEHNVPRGKTLFLFNKSLKDFVWESTDENIASVKNGMVFLKNEGRVKIIAKPNPNSGKNSNLKKEYLVNVTPFENLKECSYTNDSGVIRIHAVTSKSVKKLKVNLKIGGNTFESSDNRIVRTESGSSTCWEIPIDVTNVEEGKFTAKILTSLDGVSWSNNKNRNVCGTFLSAKKANSSGCFKRNPSGKLINFIKDWEGFVPRIEEDRLVSDVYNIGYGDVIHCGESFYNNITKAEGYVSFLKKLNSDIYVRDVNNFILKNNIECTQNQFDALVSFSYNLGTSWLYRSELKDILLSTVDSKTGHMNFSLFKLKTYPENEAIYQKLVKEVLLRHHVLSPRRCIPGLLYRRISELNMFLYGEYDKKSGRFNKNKYKIPDCIKSKMY